MRKRILDSDIQIREWLIDQYETKKLSVRDVAKLCGISASTVSRYLKAYNISARPKDSRLKELNKSKYRTKTDEMFEKLLDYDDEMTEILENFLNG